MPKHNYTGDTLICFSATMGGEYEEQTQTITYWTGMSDEAVRESEAEEVERRLQVAMDGWLDGVVTWGWSVESEPRS